MPMGFAPMLCELTAYVSGGFAQVVVRGGVGDGIETPQKIFTKAGESSVIRGSLVEKVERAIDGGMAVVQWSRVRGVGCSDSSDKTTEEEAHAGIINRNRRHRAESPTSPESEPNPTGRSAGAILRSMVITDTHARLE